MIDDFELYNHPRVKQGMLHQWNIRSRTKIDIKGRFRMKTLPGSIR